MSLDSLARREDAKRHARKFYQDYLRRIDCEAVLDYFGAENVTEITKPDGTVELRHSCIVDRVDPHHAHGDATPSACLAGDTVITLREGKNGEWAGKNKTIAEIYDLWHKGIPRSQKPGKGYRQTPQGNWQAYSAQNYEKVCLGTFGSEEEAQKAVSDFRKKNPYSEYRKHSRVFRTRSWDVGGDMYGTVGRISDVWQTGVKPLLGISTESGKYLRCTAEHRVFSGRGWITAGELRAGEDWLYRAGRGRDNSKPKSGVPRYLREAIGLWTQGQRKNLLLPIDKCRECLEIFSSTELQLDHVVPVYENIALALDVKNLRPLCRDCHIEKTKIESSSSARPGTKAKAQPDRVVKIENLPPEMTYDMEVEGWHNLTANGLVVHNSLNVSKKKWVCYSYPEGGGDIFWLIMKMEGKEEFHEIVPLLSEFLNDSVSEPVQFLKELEETWQNGDWSVDMPRFHEKVLERWALLHPYLKTRGMTKEAVRKLHVGYDETQRRITFPHWHYGQLVGWQKRRLDDIRWPQSLPDKYGRNPKYVNSSGFPKGHTLYNLDNALMSSEVVVVESPMSVLKAESLGLSDHAVATFGAKVPDAQIELMRHWQKVFVWMDGDEAGRRATARIVRKLERYTNVFVVHADQDKDLGDYTDLAEVRQKIDSAVPAFLYDVED